MKKLLLIFCALLVITGCTTKPNTTISNEEKEPVALDVTKVFAELTSDKANSIALSFANIDGSAGLEDHSILEDIDESTPKEVASLAEKINASGLKFLDDLQALVKDAKFEAIDTTSIKESNLVCLLRNKAEKVNFYIYNDGNVKMIYDLESYAFKVDKADDLIKLASSHVEAYIAASAELNSLLAQ